MKDDYNNLSNTESYFKKSVRIAYNSSIEK